MNAGMLKKETVAKPVHLKQVSKVSMEEDEGSRR